MTIENFRKFVFFIAKKSQNLNNPSPDEFNLALERAYVEFVMDNYGNKNEYKQGQIPSKVFQANQKISDDLLFLMEKRVFPLTQGKLSLPNGTTVKDVTNTVAPKYLHISTARFQYNYMCDGELKSLEYGVDVLRDSEIADVLTSSYLQPAKDRPYCAFYKDHIQFFPKDLDKIILTYLRTPKIPKWGYNMGTDGRPVYNPILTVELEAPDETHNDIAIRTLRYLGVSVRDNDIIQYSQAMKQEGI